MALTVEKKAKIVSEYGQNDKDTGSVDVQVALITERLADLQDHFKQEKKDHHSRRGLLKLVGRRRRLLEYKKKTDIHGYRDLIQRLGIRK